MPPDGKFLVGQLFLKPSHYDESKNDRYVLIEGTSGAPISDCSGWVVASISGFFSYELAFPGAKVRITTPWGQPNGAGLLIQRSLSSSYLLNNESRSLPSKMEPH